MISGRHRHKLIDGLVIAMGKPSDKASTKPVDDEKPEAEEPPVDEEETEAEAPPFGAATDGEEPEVDAEGGEEDAEALKCADDAFRAAKSGDRKGFVEAIRTIAGGYSK